MFYRSFDNYDYMQNNTYDMYGGLGNPYRNINYNPNIYQNYDSETYYRENMIPNNSSNRDYAWQKDLYPEIYNIVYPLVCNVCSRRNVTLNQETLESLVEEVYSKIEDEPELDNRKDENKKEERINRPNNNLLRDFIRILIIREFFPRRRPRPRPPHRNFSEYSYIPNEDINFPQRNSQIGGREFYHPFPEEYI